MDLERAKAKLKEAWPLIVDECRAVLGGELHYQAIVYRCLREAGVPARQIGMNVKQMILTPVTTLFQSWDAKKNREFQGGFEPIPDIVLFAPDIDGDWRRRNQANTLKHMLMAIEVKASERAGGRLSVREIDRDIQKLYAHRTEVRHLGYNMQPVMMVIDVAPDASERMTVDQAARCAEVARAAGVAWMYVTRDQEQCVVD